MLQGTVLKTGIISHHHLSLTKDNRLRAQTPPYRESLPNVRLIAEKQSWTCIKVKFGRKKVTALLDTGSDITVIGSTLARRLKSDVCPHELSTVKTANGDDMVLSGVAYVTLCVGMQDIDSEVLVTPVLTGFILGIDWMEQNNCVFSCREGQLCVNTEWIGLMRELSVRRVRKIYAVDRTVLLPYQQTEVNVRVRQKWNECEDDQEVSY